MYGKSVGGGVGGVGSWQEVDRILKEEGESEGWMKEVKEERKKVKEKES